MAAVLAVMILAGCDTDSSAAGNGSNSKTAAGGACFSDSHCADNLLCRGEVGNSVCTPAGAGAVCSIDDDCIGSLFCGGTSDNRVCTDGSAGSTCELDSHCATGLICAGLFGSRVCSQSDGNGGSVCGFNSHCDYVCSSGLCTDGSARSACSDDDECVDDLICASFRCVRRGGGTGSVCGIDIHCDSGVCGSDRLCQ